MMPLKNTKRKNIVNLLHKDLSYKIQGIAFEIRKNFGLSHKEQIYQKAFEEELKSKNISYEREKAIKIFSPKDGKFIGLYRPDFIIDKKIIVEIKTYKFVPKDEMRKIYDYLRNSEYELGYSINFASPRLYIKRIIFTNDKKGWFKKLLVFVSLLLVLFSGLSSVANAAILYLEPASGQYQPGDTFVVDVKIDTEGECVNAVEANLVYDKNILKAVDFSRGESILNLWVKNPEINQGQGLVSFSGGIPGGYCGRIPGDPGESSILGRIIFKIPGMTVREAGEDSKENLAEIKFLENSRVLLNDGLGTGADLKTKGTLISIQPETGAVITEDEWRKELLSDNVPPEPFKIEIGKDSSIFDGRYFIVFSSADKQSGLDYFEVKEGKKDWRKVQSPCLLEDQNLKSIIKVKAVDKAGNERIAEYILLTAKPFPWWKIITIIVGLAIVGWIIKKYFLKKL